jgi:hypothetical protein
MGCIPADWVSLSIVRIRLCIHHLHLHRTAPNPQVLRESLTKTVCLKNECATCLSHGLQRVRGSKRVCTWPWCCASSQSWLIVLTQKIHHATLMLTTVGDAPSSTVLRPCAAQCQAGHYLALVCMSGVHALGSTRIHAKAVKHGENTSCALYCSSAEYGTMLIVATANISVLNDVFAWLHGAFNCSWTFLVHFPHVMDPPEAQR